MPQCRNDHLARGDGTNARFPPTAADCRPDTDGPQSSSRPEEFHLRALPEPCMTLSSHTAPDARPLPLNGFASSTGSSCFQLASGQGRTTQPLRSSPITGPSTLLRAAPPLRLASVLSPSRLEPLAACPFTSSA